MQNIHKLWNTHPLQYSCLENPMDGEAWWAAVYGVAQSRTRPKRLSRSSSSSIIVSWIIIFMLAVLNLSHLSWHLFIIFTYSFDLRYPGSWYDE